MAFDAHVERLSGCRLCGSTELTSFMRLEDVPITGAFLRAPDDAEFLYPLALYLCEACGLVESQHNVNFASYYEDYSYTIGASAFAVRFAEALARALVERWQMPPGSRVLEIGSGDGTQLLCFKRLGMDVQGFEPSVVLSSAAEKQNGVPTVCALFSAETSQLIPELNRKFQLILLTHVLDHLPSQRDFFHTIRPLLDPQDGLLLIEVHDFEQTFEHKEYCLFQHEHTVYPTAASLQRMFAREGMELLDIGVLPPGIKRAHSLMVVATPRGSRYSAQKLPDLPLGPMGDLPSLRRFGEEVQQAIAKVRRHIRAAIARGDTVAGFGAGGRGIMTLAAAAKPGDLQYICDSNPAHHGLYTPASRIKIVPPSEVARNPVSEIIVFSYGYMDEIRAQLADFIAGGGRVTSLLDVLDSAEGSERAGESNTGALVQEAGRA